MTQKPKHMFFCGSIPLEHEVDVFKTLAEIGGERLRRVPDGELGDRKMWVIGQYPVLTACPALEFGPYPAEGLTRRTCYQIPLQLRAGQNEGEIAFDELGYARHALASYGLFREMKKAGTIPSQWRLQVNLPDSHGRHAYDRAINEGDCRKGIQEGPTPGARENPARIRILSWRSPGTWCRPF